MRARFVLAALVLCAGLVGCGGDEADSQAATLPPVTSPTSPAATPSASGLPTETAAPTTQGAEEFVRHFYRELAAAYVNKEPERIEVLSAPDCAVCRRYIDSITHFRDQGALVEPYIIEVVEVVAPGVEPGSTRLSASARVNFGELLIRDSANGVLLHETATSDVITDVQLVREGDAWLVTALARS